MAFTIPAMRALRILLVLSLLGMLSACSMWSEKKTDNWKSATRAESLNQLFWEDVAKGRWSTVKEHVAPLAVFKDGEASVTGAEAVIENLKSAHISAAQVGEVQSQPAGSDLVTTYTLSIDSRPPVHALTVWQQVGKTWVIVAHSASVASR